MTLSRTKPKEKECKICRGLYSPSKQMQKVCGYLCAQAYAKGVRARSERAKAIKQARETRLKLKTRQDYQREAQTEFNKFVRLRDADLPCISCGRFHQGKYDAGHYRSVGSNPALRFDEANCHRQCVPCNQHKSGNAIEYRMGLLIRIGAEEVERLEGPHEPKHYSADDLKEIKLAYRAKWKALEGAR